MVARHLVIEIAILLLGGVCSVNAVAAQGTASPAQYGPDPLYEQQPAIYAQQGSRQNLPGPQSFLRQPLQSSAPPSNYLVRPAGAPWTPEQMRALSLAAWNHLAKAKQMIEQGQFAAARPLVLQFSAMKPLEPEGYFWQGVCADGQGQIDTAISCYDKGIEQVLKAGMDCAELRTNLANDLLKQSSVDEAITQYRRAIEIDRRQCVAHLNLGRALLQKGEIQGALQCFQRSEDLHFAPVQLAYYRAKALQKAGKLDEARTQLTEVLAKIPDGIMSQTVRQEFANLSEQPGR